MTRDVFKYLKDYSTDTRLVNRLIVSAYLRVNKLSFKNNLFLMKYKVSESDLAECQKVVEFTRLIQTTDKEFGLENLIELFEFVISPSDKIVNGAIYTPANIRDYITDFVFNNKNQNELNTLKCIDFSCGCGGFLLNAANAIKRKTKKSLYAIYKENIYGIDITKYSIERAQLLLVLNAINEGEDKTEFSFNFKVANALTFHKKHAFPQVKSGFDAVLGNPPYVCSRNMEDTSKSLLQYWNVTSSGHPDLYIPFFQLGIKNLSEGGLLGFITVNTFTKSVNGRSLRKYLSEKSLKFRIINFGGEQIFKDRNTYTCICFAENNIGNVEYTLTSSNKLSSVDSKVFQNYSYKELNDHDGWNLSISKRADSLIAKIEATGKKFKDVFVTRNGIATLKNDVYKFTPERETRDFYFFTSKKGIEHKIEKGICRDIINANTIKSVADLTSEAEKIIFPYIQKNGETSIIPEKILSGKFPNTYTYLKSNKNILATRDKGNGKYEAWYAYGRRQSLDINSHKLFFPHISEKPNFVLCEDKQLLFYNGIAIVSEDLIELKIAKKIFESSLFLSYIQHTAKNYASGYFSLSRNYLKNFGVYSFNAKEKEHFLSLIKPEDIDKEVRKLYNIN